MKRNHVACALAGLLSLAVAGMGRAQTAGGDADTRSASPRPAASLGLAIFHRPLAVDFGFRYNRLGLASRARLWNPGPSWLAGGILGGARFTAASVSPLTVVNASWIGGNSDWNTAGNWTPTGVPKNGAGNTYNVTIDSGGSDYVNLDIASTIISLTLGGSSGSSTLNSSSGDALTITGAFTVGAGGSLSLSGAGSNLTAGTFSNSGSVTIGSGATLTLTGQAIGITDVVAGSSLSVGGTFNAGANSALYKLNSVEGSLTLQNGATTAATPGSGTLTVASSGSLSVNSGASAGTALTVNGGLSNSGALSVAYLYDNSGFGNALTVAGALTNQSRAII